jgi:hypothetical protein
MPHRWRLEAGGRCAGRDHRQDQGGAGRGGGGSGGEDVAPATDDVRANPHQVGVPTGPEGPVGDGASNVVGGSRKAARLTSRKSMTVVALASR